MTIPKQLLEAKICNKNTCELQQRIDKAVEYIETGQEKTLNSLINGNLKVEIVSFQKILDILKGSDKE